MISEPNLYYNAGSIDECLQQVAKHRIFYKMYLALTKQDIVYIEKCVNNDGIIFSLVFDYEDNVKQYEVIEKGDGFSHFYTMAYSHIEDGLESWTYIQETN